MLRRILGRRSSSQRRADGNAHSRSRFELGAVRRTERQQISIPLKRIVTLTLVVAVLAGSAYGVSVLLLGDTMRVREVTVVGTQITDPHALVAAAALALAGDGGVVAQEAERGVAVVRQRVVAQRVPPRAPSRS